MSYLRQIALQTRARTRPVHPRPAPSTLSLTEQEILWDAAAAAPAPQAAAASVTPAEAGPRANEHEPVRATSVVQPALDSGSSPLFAPPHAVEEPPAESANAIDRGAPSQAAQPEVRAPRPAERTSERRPSAEPDRRGLATEGASTKLTELHEHPAAPPAVPETPELPIQQRHLFLERVREIGSAAMANRAPLPAAHGGNDAHTEAPSADRRNADRSNADPGNADRAVRARISRTAPARADADAIVARPRPTPAFDASNREKESPEDAAAPVPVEVNIGSIVVRMEAEPAPPPPRTREPQTAPGPRGQSSSNRWMRSFLDR